MTLGELSLSLTDYGNITLLEVKQASHLTLICPDVLDVLLTDHVDVDVYKGTTSDKAGIIAIGNYVKYSDDGATKVNLYTLIADTVGYYAICLFRMMLLYWWDVSSLTASATVFSIFYSM